MSNSSLVYPEGSGRFYQHGWQSWNVSGWRPTSAPMRYPVIAEHRLQSTDPAHLDDPIPGGSGVGAVELAEGEVALLGSLGLDGWVSAEQDRLEGRGSGPWFTQVGDESSVFETYKRRLSAILGSRTSDPGPIWCSWYGFYGGVTSELMNRVVTELGEAAFSVIQIDDGWQVANGNWEPNEDFPGGMRRQADLIEASGRTAGLWLAPFLVDEGSDPVTRYPEMLLTDADGTPIPAAHNWDATTFCLDITRPDVLDWLVSLMQGVVDWGYRYLKLDFLYAAALGGVRHTSLDGGQAYRQAIETIRSAVGPDVYLLACGAPVLGSIGVFDGIRIGPDTAPQWDDVNRTVHLADRSGPGAADAIATSVNRLWLRGAIGLDPDVVYFRSRYCMLDADQKSLLQDLANICDFRAVSDPPWWLDSEERRAMDSFLESRPDIVRLDRNRFGVGDRQVDFSPVVDRRPW